jgi:hypothetical protein
MELIELIERNELSAATDFFSLPDNVNRWLNEGRMVSVLISTHGLATSLLISAQAGWIVKGNLAKSRELLAMAAKLSDFLILAIDEMAIATEGNRSWDGTLLEYFLLQPLVIGVLLGGTQDDFSRLSSRISNLPRAFDADSRNVLMGELAAQLADLGAGYGDRVSLKKMECSRTFGEKNILFGYHKMLHEISCKNDEAFEVARSEREMKFRLRSRDRGNTSYFNLWGKEKVSNQISFDALGVALCRLALWNGLKVNVDTALYPKVFYSQP